MKEGNTLYGLFDVDPCQPNLEVKEVVEVLKSVNVGINVMEDDGFFLVDLRYQIKIHETESIRTFYREATASFYNILISFPVIIKITLKPSLNIPQILNIIKYKNI